MLRDGSVGGRILLAAFPFDGRGIAAVAKDLFARRHGGVSNCYSIVSTKKVLKEDEKCLAQFWSLV